MRGRTSGSSPAFWPALSGRLRALAASGGILLASLVLLAAVLRLPDLAHRSSWEADQGEVMLALWRWVHQGTVPLLGLEASVGGVHHGALFYFLLLPVALVDGATSPQPEVTCVALTGIAAVVVAWWAARQLAPEREQPWAALAAALVTALSSGFVAASIALWNPSLLGPPTSVAVGGAWRAWRSRAPRWWVVALGALAVVVQLHLLGWILAPPLGILAGADLLRRPPGERRGLVLALAAGAAILVAVHGPLALHELETGGAELQRIGTLLASSGRASPVDPITRGAIIAVRVLAWPWVGLFTAALPLAAITTGALVGGSFLTLGPVALRRLSRAAPVPARPASGDGGLFFLVLTIAWGIAALDLVAPDLARVVDALPNDHHHAVLDPLVVLAGSLLLAALAVRVPHGRWAAVALLVGVAGWNLSHEPVAPAPDGGFPSAVQAATRVVAATGPGPISLVGLPSFKSTAALGFPLTTEGVEISDQLAPGRPLVVLCDDRFRGVIGDACGGPAEARLLRQLRAPYQEATRFLTAPDRWVSVFQPAGAEPSPNP